MAVNQREIHLDRILNALLDTARLDMPRELQIRDFSAPVCSPYAHRSKYSQRTRLASRRL